MPADHLDRGDGPRRRIRMTPQRRVVLEVLKESGDHPSAVTIFERARRRYPGIAYATIYNALNALVAEGYVKQLSLGEAAARYDHRTDEHAHAVCSLCGALLDLDIVLPLESVSRAAAERGFALEAIKLQVLGRCDSCRS